MIEHSTVPMSLGEIQRSHPSIIEGRDAIDDGVTRQDRLGSLQPSCLEHNGVIAEISQALGKQVHHQHTQQKVSLVHCSHGSVCAQREQATLKISHKYETYSCGTPKSMILKYRLWALPVRNGTLAIASLSHFNYLYHKSYQQKNIPISVSLTIIDNVVPFYHIGNDKRKQKI